MNAELAVDLTARSYREPFLPLSPSISSGQRAIFTEVSRALEEGSLDLPVLPDMALKIQELTDDPDIPVNRIVDLLASDPVVSMYVIKAANSAALSRGRPVSDLRGAISRLGYQMLRCLVINVTTAQLFRAKTPLINQQLVKVWKYSREVAARCYVLAQRHKHLKQDVAMLAGLVHKIGALPLYLYADRSGLDFDQPALEHLVYEYSATAGSRLLQSWDFPEEIVAAAAEHQDIYRINNSGIPDYIDVVIVASLQVLSDADSAPWRSILAAERLGYYAGDCRNFQSHHAEQLDSAKDMLGTGAGSH
jgi:HD-like signal output (HDOD) protein